LIQYFIQYGASNVGGGPKDPHQPTAAFRIPWGIQMVPGFILFVGMFFFPYSPRWLASKDRTEEGLDTLAKLRKSTVHDPKVLAEWQEITDQLAYERSNVVTSYAALVEPKIFKRVILGMSIQMWSQLCGMNIMMYYIVYIMEGANIASPLLTASIQYIINVALTLPAILYLDKWGRRPSMLLGSFGMMTWLFISGSLQGAYGHKNPGDDPNLKDITWVIGKEHTSVSKAVVACSYLFVATFATTWGPSSWTYPSEIFPTKIRAKAVSLATASNWAWNCALAFAVPPLLWNINWKMYMIFATFNGLALIHVFLAAPETKGRTLEEMDEVFDSGIPPWKPQPKSSRLEAITNQIAEGKNVSIGDQEIAVETKT
jgi:sugar porter (SP) family MFS transporter